MIEKTNLDKTNSWPFIEAKKILRERKTSIAKKGKIIVENKANSEKHETKSFLTKEIFTYSDYLVDAMTAHIDRERQKKAS